MTPKSLTFDDCELINGTYMGVLSYADDITLSCPSIWGLNNLLKFVKDFR